MLSFLVIRVITLNKFFKLKLMNCRKVELLNLPCSLVIGSVEFALLNCGKDGEVHERPVPAATALKHTVKLYVNNVG